MTNAAERFGGEMMEMKTMTTLQMESLESGDVLEIPGETEPMTVLVLLATETAVILDACDGSTPFVMRREDLVEYRRFQPEF
jgi:hypothetical protein